MPTLLLLLRESLVLFFLVSLGTPGHSLTSRTLYASPELLEFYLVGMEGRTSLNASFSWRKRSGTEVCQTEGHCLGKVDRQPPIVGATDRQRNRTNSMYQYVDRGLL